MFKTKRILILTLSFLLLFIVFEVLFFKNVNTIDKSKNFKSDDTPTIYLITPTHDRYEQIADLTRLSQTLLLSKKLFWIIIEDSSFKTAEIKNFIKNLEIKIKKFKNDLKVNHFFIKTPIKYKIRKNQPNWSKPKGVLQRNLALKYLSENYLNLDKNGVIYFLDDDNSYDVQIFEEMRFTRKVSVWPVGLAGQLLVEKPILNKNKQVVSFNSVWKPERKFSIDMAGFAINLSYYILKGSPNFNYDLPIGYQETYFLSQLIEKIDELEPKANNCENVYVWHTQTLKFKISPKLKI